MNIDTFLLLNWSYDIGRKPHVVKNVQCIIFLWETPTEIIPYGPYYKVISQFTCLTGKSSAGSMS